MAMPNVAALVRNGGIVIMSLRHGPTPPGRRASTVRGEEFQRALDLRKKVIPNQVVTFSADPFLS
jgi:hypothetical protein